VACIAASAACAQTPYHATDGNAAWLSQPAQLGRSTASGYDFGNIRTEVEARRVGGEAEPLTGSARESQSVMLNGFYDIPAGPGLKTYVGVGFGATTTRQGLPGTQAEEVANTFQVRGGVTYDLGQKVKGLLEYRLTDGGGPSTKLQVKQKGVMVGLRYQFD
jgi:opacity protein-like surface antigen